MKNYLTTILLLFPLMIQAQYKSQVWCPDNGDGTYTNPVINADYSDPDVCIGASGDGFFVQLHSRSSYPSFKGFGELGDCELCRESPSSAGAL